MFFEKRLLTICDNDAALNMRHVILHRAGYEVISASSPQRALKHLDEQHFDLIIVCYCLPMPNRQELVEKIREKTNTPVLVIAGSAADLGTPANGYVHGLDSPEELLRAVAKLV